MFLTPLQTKGGASAPHLLSESNNCPPTFQTAQLKTYVSVHISTPREKRLMTPLLIVYNGTKGKTENVKPFYPKVLHKTKVIL